jgi:hypothetical protein
MKCIHSAGFSKNCFIVEVMSGDTDLKFTVVQVKDLLLRHTTNCASEGSVTVAHHTLCKWRICYCGTPHTVQVKDLLLRHTTHCQNITYRVRVWSLPIVCRLLAALWMVHVGHCYFRSHCFKVTIPIWIHITHCQDWWASHSVWTYCPVWTKWYIC